MCFADKTGLHFIKKLEFMGSSWFIGKLMSMLLSPTVFQYFVKTFQCFYRKNRYSWFFFHAEFSEFPDFLLLVYISFETE